MGVCVCVYIYIIYYLDDDHAVFGGAEGLLVDVSCRAELVRRQLCEAGHDARVASDGDQLQLDAAHPPER